MQSINPHDASIIQSYEVHSAAQIENILKKADLAFRSWSQTSFEHRSQLMKRAAYILRERKDQYALLMALEMGKVLKDGRAEIEKCAACCDYAEHAAEFLQDEELKSDAKKSYVAYDPLGLIAAVMPWNFPFWQVFRFAAPALMAGNAGVLKHASNVCGAALAIEDVFKSAGFPEFLFATLLIPAQQVANLIAHPLVRAVTLTGSADAGRSVAAAAGHHLKKSVLELGGSDAYLILDDADVELAARVCAQSRLLNVGQSCIAAKRFIAVASVRKQFEEAFIAEMKSKRIGNPLDTASDLGPLAREDLRSELQDQVRRSVQQGARLQLGGQLADGPGFYYAPTVLSAVRPGMAAFDEETFGPVAAVIEAQHTEEALQLANHSVFGLGAAIFTRDATRAAELARRIEAGAVFVNSLVKSDPRLPFGGIKESGYGRELSYFGIREFVNIKTISM